MQHFNKLQVWQRSHKLVLALYRTSRSFPSDERFGLISQLRRAALSVPTNIAEGSRKAAPKDYARFLNIAEGSLGETEYLVLLSRDLNYLPVDSAASLLVEIKELASMLHSLRKTIQRDAA
jgi:four helix bundle protein